MSDSLLLLVGIGVILLMALFIAGVAGWEPGPGESSQAELGIAAVTGFVFGGLIGGVLWVMTEQIGWVLLAFIGLGFAATLIRVRQGRTLA